MLTEYIWDEENRLRKAITGGDTVHFIYNAGGERIIKRVENKKEILYVDKIYQLQVGVDEDVITKHIFVGETRLVSKVSYEDLANNAETERRNTFWYHPDHLGSSNYITDRDGEEYEHIEYTPFGETWFEDGQDSVNEFISHKFTGKVLDPETGLYYFGARYYDPKVSRWASADPIYDGIKEGLGVYTYCGNNPIMYIDPNGMKKTGLAYWLFKWMASGDEDLSKFVDDWFSDPKYDGFQSMSDEMSDTVLSFTPVYEPFILVYGKDFTGKKRSRSAAMAMIIVSVVGDVFVTKLGQKLKKIPIFAADDLVYGPSAGGKLRELQQLSGGKLLSDIGDPYSKGFKEWIDFSIDAMKKTKKAGNKIHFDLSHMDDIAGVLKGTSRTKATTSKELRYIYEHWDEFKDCVKFYKEGVEVCKPW